MTTHKQLDGNKALHQLMEEEFQQLVDIIEQKQIVHEDISFDQSDNADSIVQTVQHLHQQSRELGAETLADFFYQLENNARNKSLDDLSRLIDEIHNEFENVKDILTED